MTGFKIDDLIRTYDDSEGIIVDFEYDGHPVVIWHSGPESGLRTVCTPAMVAGLLAEAE